MGHLNWGLGIKGPHSNPADKSFLGLHIVRNVSKWSNLLLKMGQKLLPLAPVLLANNFDQGSLDGFLRMFQEGIMSYLAERDRLQAETKYRIDVQQCC